MVGSEKNGKIYTNLMCGDLTRFFVEIIINCIRSWDFWARWWIIEGVVTAALFLLHGKFL